VSGLAPVTLSQSVTSKLSVSVFYCLGLALAYGMKDWLIGFAHDRTEAVHLAYVMNSLHPERLRLLLIAYQAGTAGRPSLSSRNGPLVKNVDPWNVGLPVDFDLPAD
jgi:hypothetical protein